MNGYTPDPIEFVLECAVAVGYYVDKLKEKFSLVSDSQGLGWGEGWKEETSGIQLLGVNEE